MAPVKISNKSTDGNPWSWVSQVKPENVKEFHVQSAYRIIGFQPCLEARRNCKRNPYCIWGLGEKKWKDDNDGEDEEEGAAFRCEGEYAGLQNLGATCYVNSFLQLWFHNPIFRPVVLKWTPSSTQTSEISPYKPNCPLGQLQAIFARLKISKRSKIDPSDFVGSLLINTGEQQDAQEFAKLFMEFIIKLLTDYGDDKIQKLIAQSFSGQSQYETECLGCKNKTQRSEEFTELNLNVKKNLNESLDELLEDEIISDEYMCSNCQKKNTAKRRLQLLTLPPILNLQLMRFVFDREALRRKKVTRSISFPEVLEMQDKIHKRNTGDSNTYKYHLTAVLIHNGPSASSGHYVAQIKDLRNGEWLKFNDEFVDPVNKGKSQKTADENDEPDKKVKIKKSKNSPSLSSSGAYMLVYTLDSIIQNPEPDPELHEYLVDLVRREDATFEMEVNKTKSEKDFEQSVRTQRRKEVEWLYEFGKTSKNANGKNDSEDHSEEPKPKMPRYDKELKIDVKSSNCKETKMEVDEGPCDSTKDDSVEKRSNGVNSEVSALPLRKKSYSYKEIDFISVDWVSQWLDPGNPVPPIENGMLLCEHKKLAPPPPNSTPCLYRIIPTPLANVWYDHYQGGPRLKGDDVCEICVQIQCRKLRTLAVLEEDTKRVSDLVKKCDLELSAFTKTGDSIPPALLENMSWINKDSLRNWKKVAKRMIEGPVQSTNENGSQSKDSEAQNNSEEGGETHESFNGSLFCEHGNLSHESTSRKMIPLDAWTIITKYFKDAIMLNAGATPCDECRNQEQANSLAVLQNKEVATKQRSGLSDLYSNRNRPNMEKVGALYIVSEEFVSEWRRFVKDPVRYEIVEEIHNRKLMCEHNKFKYPLTFASEFLSFAGEDAVDKVCLVTPEEWMFIQENFKCDHEIKATVEVANQMDKLSYEPDLCNECVESWIGEALSRQFEYHDSPLYVIKREKGETIESEEEEPVKEPPIVTGKREVKPFNRDGWMAGFASHANDSVRRSQRPRSSKGEKIYKVSSSMTIKDLKSKICPDFKALLSDQHLFHDGKELTDLKMSLKEYSIPAKAKLYLEIDTAENGSVEEPVSTVETGFQGTLLQGGGGNVGDTRSPVQNT